MCDVLITYTHLGNVYIADYRNNRIRKIAASTGVITSIAGSSSSGSYSGDNGAATSATMTNPCGVALDNSGNFISYSFDLRVLTVLI